MSGAAFLRVKKLKGGGIITVAARHNRRVIQAEIGASASIDPTRSHLNETLTGPRTAADVGQLAKDLMARAGVVKLRKDAVMGLEIVFSLPPEHGIDERAYFTACADWVGASFGGAPVLSVDIHRDEAAPHCHVLLLPLIEGRMDGSNLIGGKQKLLVLQKDFHLKVAARYGLSKAPARLSGTAKQVAAKAVLQRLRETSDSVLQSKMWATLREVIENDPAKFLEALGIELAPTRMPGRTMAQIFTSKGKGRIAEPSNPIGFAAPEKRQTLCSVGFTPNPPPQPATTASPPAQQEAPVNENSVALDQPLTSTPNADGDIAAPALHDTQAHNQPNEIDVGEAVDAPFSEEITRVRDSDLDPARFHDGDYCPRPPPAPRRHKQACDAVLASLATRSKATHTNKGYRL